MSETCTPHHDWFTATLTFGLCCGLIISYVPQHFRIINKGSSEGFSPWFLLLGSTSSAAGMLNMVTMQWGIVRCCRVLSLGSCIEMTAGVVQVGLQWALFTIILVLYMTYYPPHLKYVRADFNTHDTRPPLHVKAAMKSNNWKLSIVLAWIVVAHLALASITTFFLLLTSPLPSTPGTPLPDNISSWATFLGVSSAMLAAIQYAPQLVHTYRLKLVGALSIPMMLIQSPGAVLMVLSIALRPGTNWTSWITFAVSGIMQGSLLIMCIFWKFRQRRLEIDDFGHPLPSCAEASEYDTNAPVPGLIVGEDMDPVPATVALATALELIVETDVQIVSEETPVGEETPLLGGMAESTNAVGARSRWFGRFTRR